MDSKIGNSFVGVMRSSGCLRSSAMLAFISGSLLLGACSYSPVHETPLSEFVSRSRQAEAGGYTAQIGDILTVKFYFNPELDFDVPVRLDGKIGLSLVGDVPAAGISTQDLSQTVTTLYKTYLNHPSATVILKTPAGHRVFVTGEVLFPGVFPLQGSETILSAVSLAGGLTDRASWNKVVLVRRLPGTTPMVTVIDLKKALTGADPLQDVAITMNDVVYVPRTGEAESDVFLRNLIWNKAPFSLSGNATWNGTISK